MAILRQTQRTSDDPDRCLIPTPFFFPTARPISDMGKAAGRAFIDFFTAQIRNANTRDAYGRNVGRLLSWIEELGQTAAIATVKQHLSAIRVLGDFRG